MFKSKKYDDETLKHLQKVQLMMLKFARIMTLPTS